MIAEYTMKNIRKWYNVLSDKEKLELNKFIQDASIDISNKDWKRLE